MRRRFLVLFVFSFSSLLAGRVEARPKREEWAAKVRAIHAALSELQIETAERLLTPLLQAQPQDPELMYLAGWVDFHRGRYDAAITHVTASLAKTKSGLMRRERGEFAKLVRETRDTVAGFRELRSEDGRFVLRHPPGIDAVLVPYAFETLRAMHHVLSEVLGMPIALPVQLEILPDAESLARVSTLSVEDIRRTGTIALCKWNRLMITSPRALVRGYPWVDTIAHEFVHLALSQTTHDRAPVWLQEGVAKFLERRWRGEDERFVLDPPSASMLQRAAQSGSLMPFERLHPSIARLPSQDAAVLAFAQVASFIDYFVRTEGLSGLRQGLKQVAQGRDAKQAFALVADSSWDKLERSWREDVQQRANLTKTAATPPLRRRFHPKESVYELNEGKVRRLMRLGDLLWGARRPAAASTEYGRALNLSPEDPTVVARYARANIASKQPARALPLLRSALERYPDFAPLHSLLGTALLSLGRTDESRGAMHEAIRLNPFDPAPHCQLAKIAAAPSVRRRETDACHRLQKP